MDNKTLEQLSVAIKIVPRLTQDQYDGIVYVLKAYYGHAGRPGLVGGSAPRSGPVSGSVQSPVRGGSDSSDINPQGSDYDDNDKLQDWFDNHPGADNLTDDQRASITDYTGGGYSNINGYLRKTKEAYDPVGVVEAVKEIDESLKGKVLGEDVTLYRGMTLMASKVAKLFEINDTYTDKGFISTSTNLETSCVFFDRDDGRVSNYERNVVLVIKAKKNTKGMPIREISLLRNEDEVLLNRNTSFKIKGNVIKPANRNLPEYTEITLETI